MFASYRGKRASFGRQIPRLANEMGPKSPGPANALHDQRLTTVAGRNMLAPYAHAICLRHMRMPYASARRASAA